MSEAESLIEYLATHDAPCPGCYRNLRGQTGSTCPACLQELSLGKVRTWHDMHGKALTPPMPVPGTPEADDVEGYLATHDVRCLGCGYELAGLKANACPECSRAIRIPEFVMVPRGRYAKSFGAGVCVAINLIVFTPIALLVLFGSAVSYAHDGEFGEIAIGLGVGGLNAAISVLIATKGYKLFKQSLWWFLAINPVTIMSAIYIIFAVIATAIFP